MEETGHQEQAVAEENSQSLDDMWGAALAEQQAADSSGSGEKTVLNPKAAVDAQPAEFKSLADSSTGSVANMELIMDIPVTVTVELGRSRIVINDLLQLGQGSVLEIDKIAGEPMEVLVNGKLIARGEVVVVNEKFGVRLTDIVSPMERIKQLK
ncbi:MAG TPA: flagellar motor switch protein FliN [Deltaproteobacteria bacterium]|nr:flagellar motor switch protein FliN [Deltaproteobacteria bacterium]